MERSEIRGRALRGVAVLVLQGALVRGLGFVGFIALAASLGTRGVGQLSFGLAVLTAAQLLVDGGLAAALIRRAESPQDGAMEAVLGIQLLGAAVVTAAGWIAAAGHGTTGLVTALIVSSVVPLAIRTPAIVISERRLRYGPIAWVDLSDTLLLYGLGAVIAALGGGLVAVAWLALARTVVGTALLLVLVPQGLTRPSLALSRARSVLRFGAKWQATAAVAMVRDQALNIGTAAAFGLSTLGLWNLAYRVMQVPFLVFQAVWRVSYPAMARLQESEEDTSGVVDRIAGRAAFLTAFILPILCSAAYFGIPAVLGPSWDDAREVIPWASLGLLVSGPVSVAAAGWLYARGHAGRVLTAVAAGSVCWVGVGLPLVSFLGVVGLALGWLMGSLAEASLLSLFLGRSGAPLGVGTLARPFACGVAGGVLGLLAGGLVGGGATGAVVGSLVAAGVFTAGAALLLANELGRYVRGAHLLVRRTVFRPT
jgi:PST family polysaccharide transporter